MRQLHIISAQPDDNQFWWQSFVQLNNARERNISDKCRLLVYTPKDREKKGVNPKWKELEAIFPEAKFFYYTDKGNLTADIKMCNYIPLLRPYMFAVHFSQHPELSKDAIFYIDGDILFNKPIDWLDGYIQDDVNYLSDTKSYLNSEYFDSKVKDVMPDKLEEYKKHDILQVLCKAFGMDRKVWDENKNDTGGAQSLLKDVDMQFWMDVYSGSMFIRNFLRKTNGEFFSSEEKGFQSWAADMWSLLFNLWRRERVVKTPKDFDFAWATDSHDRLKEVNIYHNAGITSEEKLKSSQPGDRVNTRIDVECPAFFKGRQNYVNNVITPFQDVEYLEKVITNPVSKQFCTHYYASEILRVKLKYKL